MRATFADPASLDAAFGYCRHAARAFAAGYTIEEMAGGHFMHREHPEVFAERLLRHL